MLDNANIFIATNPLVNGAKECEIEMLFSEGLRKTEIDEKKLSLSDKYNPKTEYGKDEFSKYVADKYDTIDFDNFIPLLDVIKNIVEEFNLTKTDVQ